MSTHISSTTLCPSFAPSTPIKAPTNFKCSPFRVHLTNVIKHQESTHFYSNSFATPQIVALATGLSNKLMSKLALPQPHNLN